jgi:uncharacterized membrane protein
MLVLLVGLMFILRAVFWGTVSLGAWVITRLTQHSNAKAGTIGVFDEMALAEERYARGEITREELDQTKRKSF